MSMKDRRVWVSKVKVRRVRVSKVKVRRVMVSKVKVPRVKSRASAMRRLYVSMCYQRFQLFVINEKLVPVLTESNALNLILRRCYFV